MNRLAYIRKACHKATFTPARVLILFDYFAFKYGFLYFGNSEVIVLTLLIAMPRIIILSRFYFPLYPLDFYHASLPVQQPKNDNMRLPRAGQV